MQKCISFCAYSILSDRSTPHYRYSNNNEIYFYVGNDLFNCIFQNNFCTCPESVYDTKNIFCLFERPFKIQKNDVFLFEISLFVSEILSFLYYANQISDDVIRFDPKKW